jgi:plasmid stability protein
MAAKAKQRRGRAPKGEFSGKTGIMSFRIRPDTKSALRKAAAVSKRSLSQEAEYHLRQALLEAGPTHKIMNLVAIAVDSLSNINDPKARWTDDPYLFVQALQAVNTAFELFRPQRPLPSNALETCGPRQGQFAIFATFRDAQLADTPDRLAQQQNPYWRALLSAKHALGPFIDNLQIWGMDGHQTRDQHQRSLGIRNELIPLIRKDAKTPEAMTDAETKKMWELRAALAVIANQPIEPKGGKS